MENLNSIITNNPSYLAQLAKAPRPVKFEIGGMLNKNDNTEKLIVMGLLFGVLGVTIVYICYSFEKRARELEDKLFIVHTNENEIR